MDVNTAAVARAFLPLAERLRAAGYGPALLRDRLGAVMPDDVGLLNRAPAAERLRRDRSAAGAALRLFFLEGDEPARSVATLLPTAQRSALTRAGLLAVRGTKVAARLRVDTYASLYLLADRRFRTPDTAALGLTPGDMVYPPGGDSILLADAVPPRDGERVLDLCTGSGIQALAVAARAERVVAVDLGARATDLARLNAIFNGIANVELRQGDLYAPVRGERFDLIIANPPFVPAPRRGPGYHSGGPRGGRVLRRVLAGLGAHLRLGGRAVAISHLALRRGESASDAIAPWLRGFDGRALALLLEEGTAVDLAAAQALFALDDGFAAYAREVREWVAFLDRHRIERIVLVLFAAERNGRVGFEVVEAYPRTLSLPLSKPPADRLAEWLL